MKISLPQLHILTYVLAMTTTLSMPAYPSIPPSPVSGVGLIDAPSRLISNRELTVSTGTEPVLEGRQGSAGVVKSAIRVTMEIASEIETTVQMFALLFSPNVAIRETYTQHVVGRMYSVDPTHNYVICHVDHTFSFEGVEGIDWNRTHSELSLNLGFNDFGYDTYWFGAGTFTRQGDGGFINWAYIGNVVSRNPYDPSGDVVVFAA